MLTLTPASGDFPFPFPFAFPFPDRLGTAAVRPFAMMTTSEGRLVSPASYWEPVTVLFQFFRRTWTAASESSLRASAFGLRRRSRVRVDLFPRMECRVFVFSPHPKMVVRCSGIEGRPRLKLFQEPLIVWQLSQVPRVASSLINLRGDVIHDRSHLRHLGLVGDLAPL